MSGFLLLRCVLEPCLCSRSMVLADSCEHLLARLLYLQRCQSEHTSNGGCALTAAQRRCDIIRGGMEKYMTPMGPSKLCVNPIFEIGPVEPRFSEWLVFEGLSVDETGAALMSGCGHLCCSCF